MRFTASFIFFLACWLGSGLTAQSGPWSPSELDRRFAQIALHLEAASIAQQAAVSAQGSDWAAEAFPHLRRAQEALQSAQAELEQATARLTEAEPDTWAVEASRWRFKQERDQLARRLETATQAFGLLLDDFDRAAGRDAETSVRLELTDALAQSARNSLPPLSLPARNAPPPREPVTRPEPPPRTEAPPAGPVMRHPEAPLNLAETGMHWTNIELPDRGDNLQYTYVRNCQEQRVGADWCRDIVNFRYPNGRREELYYYDPREQSDGHWMVRLVRIDHFSDGAYEVNSIETRWQPETCLAKQRVTVDRFDASGQMVGETEVIETTFEDCELLDLP